MDFQKIIDDVPDYKAFLTVDEMDSESLALAKEFPDICSVKKVGESRSGHPMYCLKIGNGPKKALLFGLPHPNEPMGAMMLTYLSRKLCTDDAFREASGYTWYMIKAADIDGAVLNEGWFKGPITLTNYARHFFRPTAEEQVEWTFPVDFKTLHFHSPIPETQALMKVMDEVKPDFMFSLHNSGFGGAYWYFNREAPEIYQTIEKRTTDLGIPLHLGEPEAPYIKELYPAIFKLSGIDEEYSYYEKFGDGTDPAKLISAGNSSDSYVKKYGTFCLVAELPYFYSPKITDTSPAGIQRADAARKGLEIKRQLYKEISSLYDKYKTCVHESNHFTKMVEMMIDATESGYQTELNFIDSNPDFKKECTVSQAFDSLEIVPFYCLLSLALCLRGAEFERDLAAGEDKEKLQGIVDEIQAVFDKRAMDIEKNTDYSVNPIRTLVRSQLSSGLTVMEYLKGNKYGSNLL